MINGLCSVIMPVYNAEQYIYDSIESVLKQSYTNIEFIIIDDASKDNTKQIIKRFADKDKRIITHFNENNSGCAYSRNIGLSLCTGEYVAFIDSDDIWDYDKIAKQLMYMCKYSVDIVYTAYEMIDYNGNYLKIRSVKERVTMNDLLKENSIIFSTTLFKKKSINALVFDGRWFHEDYIFLIECLSNNLTIFGINENLVKYRIHKMGRSFNKFNAARYRWIIYRKFLKINIIKSLFLFACYAVNGIKKYKLD